MDRDFENDYVIIQELLGRNVKIAKTIHGGNSLIFTVKIQNMNVVVKKYLGNEIRKSTSMNRESSALHFLNQNDVSIVPKLLLVSPENFMIVMEHLQGSEPKPNGDSMEAIIAFSKTLRLIYSDDDSFPNSIDGIEKTSDLLAQIGSRINSMKGEICNEDFLLQARKYLSVLSSRDYEDKVWDKTYSVSDLGIHNMIKGEGGIRFFDLEFFGADSPVKLIGDFLLHPRNNFSRTLRKRFLNELSTVYGVTESAIADYLQLSALKWSVIVMRRLQMEKSPASKIGKGKIEDLAYRYMGLSQCHGEQLLQKIVNSRI